MKKILYIAIVCFSILILGCGRSGKSVNLINNPPDLNQEIDQTNNISKDVKRSSEKIDKSADNISSIVDSSSIDNKSKEDVNSNVENIKNETNNLNNASSKLDDLSKSLSEEDKKSKELIDNLKKAEIENKKLDDENKRLKDSSSKAFANRLAWISTTSIIGIGICIALAIWTRSKTALFISIAFMVTLGISVVLTLYLNYVAWFTAGIALLVVGYFIYDQWIKSKAIKETIQTAEVAKQKLDPESRRKLFGDGAEPGIIDNIQTKSTKDVVNKIRETESRRNRFKKAPSLPEFYNFPDNNINEILKHIQINNEQK